MSNQNELIKGNAMVLILSCLAREAMHGYRIVKELESISDGYFLMKEGTLYPHLHSLENDGYIEGYWEKSSTGRERKLYRITESGMKYLEQKLEELSKFQENLNKVIKPIKNGEVGLLYSFCIRREQWAL